MRDVKDKDLDNVAGGTPSSNIQGEGGGSGLASDDNLNTGSDNEGGGGTQGADRQGGGSAGGYSEIE